MRKTGKQANQTRPKAKLGLPDLGHSRSAVLESLRSPESKRGYRHALDEFIEWYCSEPRLSFNKTVVTRYRIHLENRHLAAGTVNGRLAAVRRLAYEAADAGLLSPELAVGIRVTPGEFRRAVHSSSPGEAHFTGREPVMRIFTSRLALCCQSGSAATLATPIRARRRSSGSRSLRMSPLLMARFASVRIAS